MGGDLLGSCMNHPGEGIPHWQCTGHFWDCLTPQTDRRIQSISAWKLFPLTSWHLAFLLLTFAFFHCIPNCLACSKLVLHYNDNLCLALSWGYLVHRIIACQLDNSICILQPHNLISFISTSLHHGKWDPALMHFQKCHCVYVPPLVSTRCQVATSTQTVQHIFGLSVSLNKYFPMQPLEN